MTPRDNVDHYRLYGTSSEHVESLETMKPAEPHEMRGKLLAVVKVT